MSISQPPFQSTLVDANDRVQTPWAQWFSQLQPILQSVVASGPTSGRPTQNLYIGYPYFDTTIDQMIYWNGVIWVTYAPSTTGTSILKGNGSGGFNNAVAGIDFAPATSGNAILYGDGAGGFSSVSIGSGVTFAGGVLSATGSGGTVTAVTGTAPIASSGGNTPAISISQAGASTNGYLSSTDWNIFNSKAPATSGTSILYGDGTGGFSNVTIGSGVTFVAGTLSATGSGGTVTAVTGTAPVVSSGGTAPAISMAAATATVNGYLTSTDWNIFNNKGSGTVTFVGGTGSVNGITLTGTVTTSGNLTLGGTLGSIANSQLINSSITINGTAVSLGGSTSVGTVTAVTGSGNIASSGGTTPNITFTGTLPIANGGTNGTATPTAGSVAVGNGTQYAFTAAGSAGQVLTSNGSTVPTWATVATGIGTTGYWGSFWDTTNQTAASTTVAYTIDIGTSDPNNNGVSIISGNRITVAHAGVYNIQYSIQFKNIGTGNKNYNVDVWFRLNGVDISDSNSTYWIASKNSTVNGEIIAAVNYVLSLNAGDYIQLMWAVSDVDISIATLPATSSPTVPRTPGVIVTVTPVTEVGIGYYNLTSVSSVAIATGSKTFTTNLSNISTAFTVGTRVRVAYVTTPANYMEGVITSFSGTTLVVNVDSIGGSGTYANWTISVAGIQGSNGVTSITGTANQVIASASTGAVTLSLPQSINSGASPTFTGANFTGIPNAGLTNSTITINGTSTSLGGSISVGTVTSVGFTGGLITVATPTTTPAFTVAGTSGGIPYFSSASTWATSAALTANALIIGGGAGSAPATTTTGTGVLTALGTNVGSAGAFVTFNGALGTPSSGTVTNLTGTASININGTVGATTANTGAFTTLTSTSDATLHGLTVGLGGGSVVNNTVLGIAALQATNTGFQNTAIGYASQQFSTSGVNNTSVGYTALRYTVSGAANCAFGARSLESCTGSYNHGFGFQSLIALTSGNFNFAMGYLSGNAITTGSSNVIIGGYTGSAAPISATGSNYVVLSDGAGNIRTYYDASGNKINYGVNATSAAAPTIASATTIAPTKAITFISGVTPIVTITAPSPISLGGGQITLIPTGIFTTTTAGNIALASTAIVSRALIMTYDVTTAKWYPSY